MEAANKLLDLLKGFLQQLPSLLTLMACIIFVFTRRQRFPRVSRTLLLGLVLLLAHEIFFIIVYNWVPGWFITPGNYNEVLMRNVYLVLGLITNTTAALIMIVVLSAVFMKRDSPPAL